MISMKLRRYGIIFVRRFSVIIFTFGFVIFVLVQASKTKYFEDPRSVLNIFYNENIVTVEDGIDTNMVSSLIKVHNRKQEILNSETFGPVQNDSLILVVMVDTFVNDINVLLKSLEAINGIEEVLIIFSHSYYDKMLNSIIRSITFCTVLQIYYPFSLQLHPNEFPGRSYNDCPYNMSPEKAVKSNCIGAHSPDAKGQYRTPHKTQKKHHWWWTANTVFEKLSFSTEHTGLVIFLDDYLIFMKDFIYMTTYMKSIADSQPRCEFLSFGSKSITDLNKHDFYGIELSFWDPRNYLSLLAFDVSVWNSIVPHYDLYCSFDDSSWIRSLYYISLNRKDGKRYKTLSTLAPRAFEIRSSMRYGIFKCDLSYNLLKINEFEKKYVDFWFPKFLELYINLEFQEDDDVYDMIQGNGGFADPRDKALCHNLTVSKIKKVVLDMKYEYRDSD